MQDVGVITAGGDQFEHANIYVWPELGHISVIGVVVAIWGVDSKEHWRFEKAFKSLDYVPKIVDPSPAFGEINGRPACNYDDMRGQIFHFVVDSQQVEEQKKLRAQMDEFFNSDKWLVEIKGKCGGNQPSVTFELSKKIDRLIEDFRLASESGVSAENITNAFKKYPLKRKIAEIIIYKL